MITVPAYVSPVDHSYDMELMHGSRLDWVSKDSTSYSFPKSTYPGETVCLPQCLFVLI